MRTDVIGVQSETECVLHSSVSDLVTVHAEDKQRMHHSAHSGHCSLSRITIYYNIARNTGR